MVTVVLSAIKDGPRLTPDFCVHPSVSLLEYITSISQLILSFGRLAASSRLGDLSNAPQS